MVELLKTGTGAFVGGLVEDLNNVDEDTLYGPDREQYHSVHRRSLYWSGLCIIKCIKLYNNCHSVYYFGVSNKAFIGLELLEKVHFWIRAIEVGGSCCVPITYFPKIWPQSRPKTDTTWKQTRYSCPQNSSFVFCASFPPTTGPYLHPLILRVQNPPMARRKYVYSNPANNENPFGGRFPSSFRMRVELWKIKRTEMIGQSS